MFAENKIDRLACYQVTEKANNSAPSKAINSFLPALYLTIIIGLFISLAFMLYTTITTGEDGIASGLKDIMNGFALCVSNIFPLLTDILIQNFTTSEFGIAIIQNPSTFASLATNNFIFHYLISVTNDNIIAGGVITALIYWMLYQLPIQKTKLFINLNIFYYLTIKVNLYD